MRARKRWNAVYCLSSLCVCALCRAVHVALTRSINEEHNLGLSMCFSSSTTNCSNYISAFQSREANSLLGLLPHFGVSLFFRLPPSIRLYDILIEFSSASFQRISLLSFAGFSPLCFEPPWLQMLFCSVASLTEGAQKSHFSAPLLDITDFLLSKLWGQSLTVIRAALCQTVISPAILIVASWSIFVSFKCLHLI